MVLARLIQEVNHVSMGTHVFQENLGHEPTGSTCESRKRDVLHISDVPAAVCPDYCLLPPSLRISNIGHWPVDTDLQEILVWRGNWHYGLKLPVKGRTKIVRLDVATNFYLDERARLLSLPRGNRM